MESKERADLKIKIDKIGRLAVSDALGIPYGSLSSKLNGYAVITDIEEQELKSAVEKLSNK